MTQPTTGSAPSFEDIFRVSDSMNLDMDKVFEHYICLMHPKTGSVLAKWQARWLGSPIRAHARAVGQRNRKRALMGSWHPRGVTPGKV